MELNDRAWYYATSTRATFAYETHRDVVVHVAPYGRRWLIGKSTDEAAAALRNLGYRVIRGDR